MNQRLRLATLAMAALALAACGTSEDLAPPDLADGVANRPEATAGPDQGGDTNDLTGLPVIDPFTVEGDIVTAGSSTVFPLSEAVAAQFEDEGYAGQVTIDSIGSGAGFERFCVAGETDIANASRPIQREEIQQCADIGRDPIELRVGTDALAVVVSRSNYFVEDLDKKELAVAFSTAHTWADVNPDFPAHPIARFSPGTDSGTFDYFVEAVFEEDDTAMLQANPQLSEDDNVLAQGVAGDGCTQGDETTTCAIGYFGYAYFTENQETLRAVSINGVEPSAETVQGEYPLARPLFMYSDATIMTDRPQVARFIAYYLNNVNEVISEVGYFPAPDEVLVEAATTVREAAGDALPG